MSADREAFKALVDRHVRNIQDWNNPALSRSVPGTRLEESRAALVAAFDALHQRCEALRELVAAYDDPKDEQKERWHDALSTARALVAMRATDTKGGA